MHNKKIILLFLCFSLFLSACSKKEVNGEIHPAEVKESTTSNTNYSSSDYQVSSADQVAEKLEVYYFHRTARCYSCKTIGQFVKETMAEKYGEQIDNGLIDYKEVNVDLAENKDLAMKFQASGSSLYINRIVAGENNIEQDTNVWLLLRDEAKFKTYLENKINSYLNI